MNPAQIEEKEMRQIFLDTFLYAANYNRLQGSISFIDGVDYTLLVELMGQIPQNYFTKFCIIQKVTATGPIKQEYFLWFLKNLDRLKVLQLTDTNLTQSFFDELPTVCSLVKFKLIGDLELDFDFVAKFIKLIWLSIRRISSIKSATSLIRAFRNLKHLRDDELVLHFKNVDYIFQWQWEVGNLYDVFVLDDHKNKILKEEDLNLDQVVRYFELQNYKN